MLYIPSTFLINFISLYFIVYLQKFDLNLIACVRIKFLELWITSYIAKPNFAYKHKKTFLHLKRKGLSKTKKDRNLT